jgi:hypothetical protein
MADLVRELATRTGISSDMIEKGLGALLSFLKQELGDDHFAKVESSVPGAAALTSNFESAPPPEASSGSLFGVVSDLAGKLLGGKAGQSADLLSTLSKLGFKPEQIEAFLPKALELIKSHLPPELLQKILANLPALAKLLAPASAPSG